MFQIIIKDIITAFSQYTPYAIVTGFLGFTVVFITIRLITPKIFQAIIRSQKMKIALIYLFYVYCFGVLSVTILSREPGSRDAFDLRLFSTFSIKITDNIYPVENIILFLPLGFILPFVWTGFRKLYRCLLVSAGFSVTIEVIQRITERGFFQLDDILTNIMGAILGYGMFCLLLTIYEIGKHLE